MFCDAEKLCLALGTSVNLLQNYDTLCNSPKVIQFLRDSLPALEVHKNTNFFNFVIDVFCVKMIGWKQISSLMDDVRFITLTLMAHGSQWIQEAFYSMIHDLVIQVLGGVIRTKDSSAIREEASLSFLLHPAILIEICSQGLESESKNVCTYKNIMTVMFLFIFSSKLNNHRNAEMCTSEVAKTLERSKNFHHFFSLGFLG